MNMYLKNIIMLYTATINACSGLTKASGWHAFETHISRAVQGICKDSKNMTGRI